MKDQHLKPIMEFIAADYPLCLLLGKAGVGKTQICDELVDTLRIAHRVIRIKAITEIKAAKLVRILSKHWDTPISDESLPLGKQLELMLQDISDQEGKSVLIIEDAHLLPFSVLAAITHLSTLQDDKPTRLYIVLSGEAELHSKVQSLQAKPIPYIDLDLENAILQQHNQEEVCEATTVAGVEANNPEWFLEFCKKHAVKTTSVVAIIGLLFFVKWFDEHPLDQPSLANQPSIIAQHTTQPKAQPPIQLATQTKIKRVVINKHSEDAELIAAAATRTQPSALMNKHNYSIQLKSGRDKAALIAYAKQHNLQNTKVVKTKLDNQPWYLLTYGEYQGFSQAKQAFDHLPAPMKDMHPWIRPESMKG